MKKMFFLLALATVAMGQAGQPGVFRQMTIWEYLDAAEAYATIDSLHVRVMSSDSVLVDSLDELYISVATVDSIDGRIGVYDSLNVDDFLGVSGEAVFDDSITFGGVTLGSWFIPDSSWVSAEIDTLTTEWADIEDLTADSIHARSIAADTLRGFSPIQIADDFNMLTGVTLDFWATTPADTIWEYTTDVSGSNITANYVGFLLDSIGVFDSAEIKVGVATDTQVRAELWSGSGGQPNVLVSFSDTLTLVGGAGMVDRTFTWSSAQIVTSPDMYIIVHGLDGVVLERFRIAGVGAAYKQVESADGSSWTVTSSRAALATVYLASPSAYLESVGWDDTDKELDTPALNAVSISTASLATDSAYARTLYVNDTLFVGEVAGHSPINFLSPALFDSTITLGGVALDEWPSGGGDSTASVTAGEFFSLDGFGGVAFGPSGSVTNVTQLSTDGYTNTAVRTVWDGTLFHSAFVNTNSDLTYMSYYPNGTVVDSAVVSSDDLAFEENACFDIDISPDDTVSVIYLTGTDVKWSKYDGTSFSTPSAFGECLTGGNLAQIQYEITDSGNLYAMMSSYTGSGYYILWQNTGSGWAVADSLPKPEPGYSGYHLWSGLVADADTIHAFYVDDNGYVMDAYGTDATSLALDSVFAVNSYRGRGTMNAYLCGEEIYIPYIHNTSSAQTEYYVHGRPGSWSSPISVGTESSSGYFVSVAVDTLISPSGYYITSDVAFDSSSGAWNDITQTPNIYESGSVMSVNSRWYISSVTDATGNVYLYEIFTPTGTTTGDSTGAVKIYSGLVGDAGDIIFDSARIIVFEADSGEVDMSGLDLTVGALTADSLDIGSTVDTLLFSGGDTLFVKGGVIQSFVPGSP